MIEQQFSDFIEDQRELEGRLFYRWHTCVLMTYNGTVAAIPGAVLTVNPMGNNNNNNNAYPETNNNNNNNAFNVTSPTRHLSSAATASSPMMIPSASTTTTTNKLSFLSRSSNNIASSSYPPRDDNNTTATATATPSTPTPNNNNNNNNMNNTGGFVSPDGKPHVTALRVTPQSIKAFIRYFATDVVGSKYDIPADYINAMIALTESLFYK